MIEVKEDSEGLILHYYLSNDSHSMDAVVFNKAEKEILNVIYEVASILDVDIYAETQALEEGGIKAIYKFLNKKKTKKNLTKIGIFFAGILATVISDVVSENIKSDSNYEELKKQELKLRIEKLKQELEEKKVADDERIKIINNISIYISETNKVKISKSNFYSNLLKERKLEKVSTQRIDTFYNIPISEEKVVPRQDFERFIIESAEIEDDYQEQIAIEIVSPVLKGGNLKWKGMYGEERITFSLKDKLFKNLVISKNLSFSNGTKLICDLETKQKMNSDGEIISGAKSVYNVTAILYADGDKVDIIH